jgi:hypothetical protein
MEESIRVMVSKEIQRIIQAQKQWDNMSDVVKRVLSSCGIKQQLQRNSYITVGVGNTNTDKKIVIDSAISIVEDELKNSGLTGYRIAIFTANDDRLNTIKVASRKFLLRTAFRIILVNSLSSILIQKQRVTNTRLSLPSSWLCIRVTLVRTSITS